MATTKDVMETQVAGFPAMRIEGRTERPPLLFVHGAFVTHESFAPWLARLGAAGWRGVAPSRRGRLGVGPAQARGLRVEDYVDDTRRVIDALGEAPVIVGHSLGGLVAQRLAEEGRAAALVLLAPAPATRLAAQPVAIPALLPMVPRILAGAPVRPSCASCENLALNRVPKEDRARTHEGLVHESGAAYRDLIFGKVRVDPRKVQCPVLVLSGSDDHIISPAQARWTAERYHGELEILDGHGHWLIEEPGWEAIADRVHRWAEGHSGSRRSQVA